MSYTLIGEHKKDARANRDGYIAAMTELMENDPTIVHVDCDLGGCINVGKLQAKFPDRVFNAGIAEQNAVGVASGMAAAGMKASYIPLDVSQHAVALTRRFWQPVILRFRYISSAPIRV